MIEIKHSLYQKRTKGCGWDKHYLEQMSDIVGYYVTVSPS